MLPVTDARVLIEIDAAMLTKSAAVLTAERLNRQGQDDLLTENLLQLQRLPGIAPKLEVLRLQLGLHVARYAFRFSRHQELSDLNRKILIIGF